MVWKKRHLRTPPLAHRAKNRYAFRFGHNYQNPNTPPHQFLNIKMLFSYNFTETRKKIYHILLYLAVDQAKYTPPNTLAHKIDIGTITYIS